MYTKTGLPYTSSASKNEKYLSLKTHFEFTYQTIQSTLLYIYILKLL